MVMPVPSIDAGTSIVDCFKVMTSRRFRHFVVRRDGEAIGVVSIGDLVKAYTRDIELENAVLRDMTAARIVTPDPTY